MTIQPLAHPVRLAAKPRFGSISDFSKSVGASPEQVAQQLPQLFEGASGDQALALYQAIREGSGGLAKLVKAVAQALPLSERVRFINDVVAGAESVKSNAERGQISSDGKTTTIFSFDNEEGKAAAVSFDTVKRPKVFGPETDARTFLQKTVGDKPRIVIGSVGWTIPDMAAALDTDKQFQKVVNGQLRDQVARAVGQNQGDLFDQAFTRAKKELAGELYQLAYEKFWGPIDHYLFEKADGPKLDPGKFVFLTSASYAGVDKAAMDFAGKKNIPVLNVTPFCYAEWMDTDRSDPLLLTNDVDSYAKIYNQLTNVLLVTGGRAHAANQDAKRSLFDENNAVIPVDVMSEFGGFDIPGISGSGVANAARLLLDMGFDATKSRLAKNFRDNTGLTDTQKAVAANIETLYNKIAAVDTNKLAQKAAAKVLKQ